MSKTVGKILAVAAIVVGVVAAVPTFGASLGLSAAAASLIGVGIAAATFVNSSILASKAKGQLQARQASVAALQFGEVAREGLLGEALTGGSLVDAFNWGGKDGTDWECRVIDLVDHFCDGLVGFFVNDTYVPFTGDGPVAGYNGQLEVYWRPGTMTQTVPAVVLANGPGWTPADIGAGVAWVAVCYKADKADAKAPVWPGGRPAFAWLVRGKRCYQARKDSSVGGSGSHRWHDPSTWEWTDNLIDCRYNWVRGIYAGDRIDDPDMLLVGRGLTAIEAPPVNVFAPANLCDELVAIDAGGTEKRYTVNGVIKADEPYIDVEEHFAAACGGVILQPEGAVEIEPGQAKAPVFFFSDEDLLVGSTVEFSEDLPESDEAWVNTVSPRYVDPALKFTDHAAPVRRVVSDIIIDGGPREQSLSLTLVTSATQAGRVGEIARRLGRLLSRGKVTLGPTFAEVEEGDWGVWTSQRYLKGRSVLFRVEAYNLNEKWHNTLTLREISPLVYARDADKASTSIALQPGDIAPIGQPGAGTWIAKPVSLTQGDTAIPGIEISGATDNDYADLVRFEFLPAEGVADATVAGGWRESGVAGPDVRSHLITSVAPKTYYYLAVSYMVGRRPGPRRILGPISTDPTAADWETVKGPNKPADNATNSADPASPFGPGGTVGGTIKQITDNQKAIKAVEDANKYVETVTIPAINKAVDDANERIIVARQDAAKAVADANTRIDGANDAIDKTARDLDAEIDRAVGVEETIQRRVERIVATGGDIDGQVRAAIEAEEIVRARDDQALGRRIEKVSADIIAADAAVRADVKQTTDALARQDEAFAGQVREINASLSTVDSRIGASATDVTRAFTSADLALSGRSTVLEASAANVSTGVVRNDTFNVWTHPQPMPAGWAVWVAQGNFSIERGAPGRVGQFYVRTRNDVPNVESGFFQTVGTAGPGKWIAEVTVASEANGLSGAGVTLHGIWNIDFCGDPDTNGRIGDSADGEVRTWSKTFDLDGRDQINVHAMLGWTGFGRTIVPKYLTWHRLSLRPADDGDIKAGKADAALNAPGGVLARLTATDTVLADLPNRFASVQRAATLEAQVNGEAGSRLLARADERATVIADGKVGPVAEVVRQLQISAGTVDSRIEAKANDLTRLFGEGDRLLGERASSLETAVFNGPDRLAVLSARIKSNEDTLVDLPNRYATARRAEEIAAYAGGLGGRVDFIQTAVTDGRFAAAQTVQTLRAEYDQTVGTVRQQAGAIAGIDTRTSVYWEVTGTTSDGQAIVRLSKSDGSRGVFYIGADLLVDGNAIINGTVFGRAIAGSAVQKLLFRTLTYDVSIARGGAPVGGGGGGDGGGGGGGGGGWTPDMPNQA